MMAVSMPTLLRRDRKRAVQAGTTGCAILVLEFRKRWLGAGIGVFTQVDQAGLVEPHWAS